MITKKCITIRILPIFLHGRLITGLISLKTTSSTSTSTSPSPNTSINNNPNDITTISTTMLTVDQWTCLLVSPHLFLVGKEGFLIQVCLLILDIIYWCSSGPCGNFVFQFVIRKRIRACFSWIRWVLRPIDLL